MSTDTDGSAPSVASPADTEPDSPGDGSAAPGEGTTGAWLQAEIRRRMAANAGGSGGRHARRDAAPVVSRPDYVPRHAGGGAPAGVVAPAATTAPAPAGPGSAPPAAYPPGTAPAPADPGPEPSVASRPGTVPSPAPSGSAAAAASPPAASPPANGVTPPYHAPAPAGVPPLGGPSLPAGSLPVRRGRPRVPPPTRSPDPGAVAPGGLRTPPGGSPPPPPAPGPSSVPAGAPHRLPGGAPVGPAPARPAPEQPRPDLFRPDPPGPGRRGPERPASRPAPADDAEPTGDTVLWSRPADAPPLPGPAPRPAGPPPGPAARPPEPPGGAQQPTGPDGPPTGGDLRRVRVVLSERKGVAKPVRTIRQVQEDDEVGELLRRNLIGSQLTVALRFAVFAAVTLGMLPVLFAVFPEIGRAELLGLRVPWLLLGVAVYPFLLALGWWHARTAERVEQNFAEHVQD